MRLFNRYYSKADLALVLGDIALVICVTAAVRGVMHAVNMTDAHKWGLWVTQGETIAAFTSEPRGARLFGNGQREKGDGRKLGSA